MPNIHEFKGPAYSLRNIIDDNSAVGISVVHWRKGLVSFLSSCIPYLKLDGCSIIEGYRLR